MKTHHYYRSLSSFIFGFHTSPHKEEQGGQGRHHMQTIGSEVENEASQERSLPGTESMELEYNPQQPRSKTCDRVRGIWVCGALLTTPFLWKSEC